MKLWTQRVAGVGRGR